MLALLRVPGGCEGKLAISRNEKGVETATKTSIYPVWWRIPSAPNRDAPLYIRARQDAASDYASEMQLSDSDAEVAFNGAARPDLFKELLLRIRDGNPTVIITENGAPASRATTS